MKRRIRKKNKTPTSSKGIAPRAPVVESSRVGCVVAVVASWLSLLLNLPLLVLVPFMVV
jgi:hypothetical protein